MKLKILSIIVVLAIAFGAKAQVSTITSISPNTGSTGTLVTILGLNLANTTSVNIGGISSVIVSNKNDSIVAMVMPGSVTGNIAITTTNGTYTSTTIFSVIQSMIPVFKQSNKLIGSMCNITDRYGGFSSVALSADGNTAIIGIAADDSAGGVWIYNRNGGVWSQQGNKLLANGNVYSPSGVSFGSAVALSADGNTALIGASRDNNDTGASWIFTRNGNSWIQQGNKLVGSGSVLSSRQGVAVALSADGNTAIIGGNRDYHYEGAIWVFVRTNGAWTQQGSKLVATTYYNMGAEFGSSLSISADGNIVVAGSPGEKNGDGAAWIFTRTNGAWSQQGNKLVGVGGTYHNLGSSVSISADGNTVIIGAPAYGWGDSTIDYGSVWVFKRNGNIWTQDGNRLLGIGGINGSDGILFGSSVSLSADGNTAIVGGEGDSNYVGAIWVFLRNSGSWIQQGSKLVGSGYLTKNHQGVSVALCADGSTIIVGGGLDSNNISNNTYIPSWVFNGVYNLPLTILQFTIIKQGNSILLNWQTTTEINASHFNIQRSTTGKDFTTTGSVNAKGASEYSFKDIITPNGVVYYRLEIVDKDGSKTYSEVKELRIDNGQLIISPNPAKDMVTISGSNLKQVTLVDFTGRPVITKEVNSNSIKLAIGNLSKGIYLVKATLLDGSTKADKLLVK